METIVNNPAPTREIIREDSGGWLFATVILLLVAAAGAYGWMYMRKNVRATPAPVTNIQVTIPSPLTEPTPTQDQ